MVDKTGKIENIFRDIPDNANSLAVIFLNQLLAELPKEEQIKKLVTALKEYWALDKNIIFLQALKRIFSVEKQVAFHKLLMEIYLDFPIERYGMPRISKSHLVILKEILEGWRYERPEWPQEEKRLIEDGEKCFDFICKAYLSGKPAYLFKELRQGIISLFREYFARYSVSDKNLGFWICKEGTPGAIASVLLHAKIGEWNEDHDWQPIPPTVKELWFIEPFGLHGRSVNATTLVQNYMKIVRVADELAIRLTELAHPMVKSGEIFCHLETADIVHFRVKLVYKKGVVDDPADIFKKVRAVRDELIASVKYPPQIFIAIENPDGGIVWTEEK